MQKINKICTLSTVYYAWQATATTPYDSNASTNSHYPCVLMQLLLCQNGLCAYTEQRIAPREAYQESNWQNGQYDKTAYAQFRPQLRAHLDHFDASLKKSKPWDWDNFLFVEANTNAKKGTKVIDPRLKPDSIGYNPFDWFDYDVERHHFLPHPDLLPAEEAIVEDAINFLGLNNVAYLRKDAFKRCIADMEMDVITWADFVLGGDAPDQFFTAAKFIEIHYTT